MTRPKARLARGVRNAEVAIGAAYWDACDDAQAAIDPAGLTDVTWAQIHLAGLYKAALAIEAVPQLWSVARIIFGDTAPQTPQRA